MSTAIHHLPRLYLITLCALGAFSRFTHGRYTPTFYRYQISHAPDDDSTRLIPFVDTTMCALLVFGGSRVRLVAALLCVVFQSIGIVGQLKKGLTVRLGWLSFFMAAAAGWVEMR